MLIQYVKVLLYVIDAAGTESRQPHEDLKCLRRELELYDPELLEKPSVVFLNKTDIKGM
jgi:GTP-binding protein